MSTSGKPAAANRCPALRPAVVLLGGAVCATVAGIAPAHAQDRPEPPAVTHTVADVVGPAAGAFGAVPIGAPAAPDPAALIASVLATIPGPPAAAPIPAVAPVPAAAPVPAVTAAPVADPAAPPTEEIRIGSLQLGRPGIVAPDQAAAINAGAAEMHNGLSDVIESQGVDAARADEVAGQMMGDAVIGAAVGGAVVAPVAAAVGAVVGGVTGFVFGIPFLPTGLVVGPIVGATTVAAMVAAPAVIAGAVIGAGMGAAEGWNAPLGPPPAG